MDELRSSRLDELVAALKTGDREAIAKIIDLLKSPVRAYLAAFDLPEAEIDDVASEFFHELFATKIWKYEAREGKSAWAWLLVVLANEARDWHRAEANNLEHTGPSEDTVGKAQVSVFVVQREALSEERAAILMALEDALAQLSDEDQALLRLKEVEGLNYEQIAGRLRPGECPTSQSQEQYANALKTRFFRAKEKVRRLMADDPRVPKALFGK